MHGTLVKWNADRGFGFIALPQSQEDIFVHISAFPRDGGRPRIGEMISFDVRTGPDGRKRAENVERPGVRKRTGGYRDTQSPRSIGGIAVALTIAIAGGLGAVGYATYESEQRAAAGGHKFTCDGRTHCSQMTSCAEAEFFLENCPNTEMDGNGDGEPCEQQWCN
jgi:cold shock CspA family protein